MISVILYGRNDQHGYNYHKRLVISINCLAEVLSDPLDEILFVDYNTPDDLPTLIESIEDILTEKAKTKLKIFRVRQALHQKLGKTAERKVLESLARNIAIRRANPSNRWILSTNSDMIVIPRDARQTLTHILANLPNGFYTLPRFELPEYFWETYLARSLPVQNIALLREQADKLHLNMVVQHKPYIGFENVGDFQLMLREDIFNIGGFNEAMVFGWHIDSNLSKRMHLLHKKIDSLANDLIGYHCNHTRRETDLHAKSHLENNWKFYIEDLETPFVKLTRDWGLPDEEIETFDLINKSSARRYLQALRSVQMQLPPENHQTTLCLENYNSQTYSTAHIFPYLVDHFANLPKKSTIAYLGYNTPLINRLAQLWKECGFTGNILVLDALATDHLDTNVVITVNQRTLLEQSSVYIFDFGFDEKSLNTNPLQRKPLLKKIMQLLLTIARYEKKRRLTHKFIGINAAFTDFKYIFKMKFNMSDAGCNSNICYGYVEQDKHYTLWPKHFRYHFIKNVKLQLQYIIVRYFFNFSDKIRNRLINSFLAKFLFKSGSNRMSQNQKLPGNSQQRTIDFDK